MNNYWYKKYVEVDNKGGDSRYREESLNVYGWGESVILQSYIYMYEITGERKWLDKFTMHTDYMLDKLIKFDDGYSGWISKNGQNTALVLDGHSTLPLAQFIRLVVRRPELESGYGYQAEKYLDYIETNVIKRWEDPRSNVGNCWVDISQTEGYYKYPDRPHCPCRWNFLLVFAHMLITLYDVNGNTSYLDKAIKIHNYFKKFLHLKLANDERETYIWTFHNEEFCVNKRKEDMSHGQVDMGSILEMYRHGLIYDGNDMLRFTRTFTDNLWRGDYENSKNTFQDLVDGTFYKDGADDDGRFNNRFDNQCRNWLELTWFDEAVRKIVEAKFRKKKNISFHRMMILAQLIKWDPERVVNGDFEYWNNYDITLPAHWQRLGSSSSAIFLDCVNKQEGKHGLTIKADGISNQCIFQNWKGWSPSTGYEVRVTVKAGENAKKSRVVIKNKTRDKVIVNKKFTNQSWETIKTNFQSPDNKSDTVRIELRNSGNNGSIYFNNIRINKTDVCNI